jgi:hypothetical protein
MKDNFRDAGGYGAMSPVAKKLLTMSAQRDTAKWMHKQKQLCAKCQTESVTEKGCRLIIKPGLKLYICKACVDAKKTERIE